MGGLRRFTANLPWLFFLLWLLLQVPSFVNLAAQGKMPIDFLAYRLAADALERGESPYLTPDQSRQIWRYFHQNESAVLAADAQGEGQKVLRELDARPQQPGPYLYPPTLALLIAQLDLSPLIFASLTLLSILGFGWLWLRSTGGSSLWLALIIFSLDVLASLSGGNVELLLLFITLLAARLLWAGQGPFAAPLTALVILIKPFYGLFFLAFGLLQLLSHPAGVRGALRSLVVAAILTLVVVTLEVYRWGAQLQADALFYLQHALEYHWFVLPLAEQTPMSAWNRSPLQGLVSAGLPAALAQWVALALWFFFVLITMWCARGVRLTFPLAFALSLVLLYWGRSVGWGLIYLELVVAVTVWPSLVGWQKAALLGTVLALMGSHWWALVLTTRGHGMPLLTLQSADFPWETWLVIPGSWLLLLRAVALTHTSRTLGQRRSRLAAA